MALEIKDLKVGTVVKDINNGNTFKVLELDKNDTGVLVEILTNFKQWFIFQNHDLDNFEIVSQPPKLKQVILTMTEEQVEKHITILNYDKSIYFYDNKEGIEPINFSIQNEIVSFEIKDVE